MTTESTCWPVLNRTLVLGIPDEDLAEQELMRL